MTSYNMKLFITDTADASMLWQAPPADYWDTADLKALDAGGLVNEDVMQRIWDISRIPLPFTDRIGTDTAKNSFTEWTEDELGLPNTGNAVVSGADATGNDAAGGSRVGNHCQNSIKVLAVTERAQSTDQIGRADELAYQLMMRQQELRRDVEAISMTPQASQADDNDTVPGLTGGYSAWLTSNTDFGAGGADGGFNNSTRLVDAPTPGAARALSLTTVDDMVESVFNNNGDPTILMSVPGVIRRLNDFLFTQGDARIARPTANVSGQGGGVNQTAQGYINVFITEFGTSLTLVPNRLQQTYDSADGPPAIQVADVFLVDTARVALAFLKGYQSRPLAKLGLSERAQLSVDWTVKVYVEKAHAVIRDIDPTEPVVA